MVIEGKNGDLGSPPMKPKKTFSDDLHSTFSSPLAWILVLALVITWTCVFVIMFDLTDYKTISGRPPPPIRKVLKDSGRRGGLSRIGSDPLKAVNDAVDESTNLISVVFKFAANLIAPEEDEGNLYAVRKKEIILMVGIGNLEANIVTLASEHQNYFNIYHMLGLSYSRWVEEEEDEEEEEVEEVEVNSYRPEVKAEEEEEEEEEEEDYYADEEEYEEYDLEDDEEYYDEEYEEEGMEEEEEEEEEEGAEALDEEEDEEE
ncbi:triadin-like, partial [Notolabrus celidotus]|uniref:triadin-like n=1 Tax=Notolabrus celidotus TaxID=1203425 RepID=UPI00148FAB68